MICIPNLSLSFLDQTCQNEYRFKQQNTLMGEKMNADSMKQQHRKTWLQWTAAAAAATFLSAHAFGAQTMPNSMAVSIGSYNGKVGALAQANEGKVVNFYTNQKGNLRVDLKYNTAGLSANLTLAGVFRQHSGADTFILQSLNSSGVWINVGSTKGGTASRAVNLPLPSGTTANGTVSVRLISNNGADDLDLDQLIIADSDVSPTPPPTLPPTNPPSSAGLPAGEKWYWQLSGQLNTNVSAKVYDIDAYDTTAPTIASLKAAGHKVICYFSAGTYEDWRSDASQFPTSALGNNVSGWAGEKWLDVRNSSVRNIMVQRMDMAKSKGCDGVEPDNVDGYANKSGFPLTSADQINFDTFLADQAHARGMIVALKNTAELVSSLVNKFDFAVAEECFRYNECSMYSAFIQQNKAVLSAEYTNYSNAICAEANSLKFSTVFYNLNLDGTKYQPCP